MIGADYQEQLRTMAGMSAVVMGDPNGFEQFDQWLAEYRESVIDEVEDHLVRRDQFTERTLIVIDELRGK